MANGWDNICSKLGSNSRLCKKECEKGKTNLVQLRKNMGGEKQNIAQTIKGNPKQEEREGSIQPRKLSPRKLRLLVFLSFPLDLCSNITQLGEDFLITQYKITPPHPLIPFILPICLTLLYFSP